MTLTKFDDSHKYTDVKCDGYIGVGNAHHHYIIERKEKVNDAGEVIAERKTLLEINFQDGAIKEAGINGVMDENLIAIVIDRLEGFQSGPYACDFNERALNFFRQGLAALQDRTKERESRNVEGTHKL